MRRSRETSRDMVEQRLRVGVGGVVGGGDRRQPDAGAPGADLGGDRVDHLEQEARAVLDASRHSASSRWLVPERRNWSIR